MKKDIQPSYGEAVVRKLVDSGGRVDRFKKRYGM